MLRGAHAVLCPVGPRRCEAAASERPRGADVTWDWGQAGEEALDAKLRNGDSIWTP